MTQQSELEKTQAELAKLQLEREKLKFAREQKRQQMVDGLGAGVMTAGRATGWLVGRMFTILAACIAFAAVGVVVLSWGAFLWEFLVVGNFTEYPALGRIAAALAYPGYYYVYAAIAGVAYGGWFATAESPPSK